MHNQTRASRTESTLTDNAIQTGSRRRGMWIRLGILFLLLILLGIVSSVTGCLESRMFYFPGSRTPSPPPGVEEVWIPGPDNAQLHAWLIRADQSSPGERRPAVLHVHGNAGTVDDHLSACEWLRRDGIHVLLFDYRGFGRSDPGSLRRAELVADTHAALDFLLNHPDVDPDRVGVYGWSLGAVIALAVASEREEVQAVAAVSGFSSWKGIAADKVPLLGPLMIHSGYDAVDSVRNLGSRPLLLVHGDNDRIVPAHHSRRLAEAARDAGVEVEYLTLPDAGHLDWLWVTRQGEATIRRFFREELVDSDK